LTGSAEISMIDCLMIPLNNNEKYSISSGLVELGGGKLNIDNLEIRDINLLDYSVV
jgi:hypothetical protein